MNDIETILSNLLAISVVFGFFFFLYAKMTKKTIGEAWEELVEIFKSED